MNVTMQAKVEINKTEKNTPEKGNTLALTPYGVANLAFKTGVISLAVTTVSQPMQAILTRLQMQNTAALKVAWFRGFGSNVIAGQKRGAIAVSSKQANKESGVMEEGIEPEYKTNQRWTGTMAFAQADHFVSNALYGKSKLQMAGILTAENFKWSVGNFWRLTQVNWGSRSISNFVNFAAIGFIGDYFTSWYHSKNELLNKIGGGATAGVFATVLTTVPNSYADKKLLASRIENKRIITTSPYTLFKQVKAHTATVGAAKVSQDFLRGTMKELLVRSPLSAVVFATIMGLDHVLGAEPLNAFKTASESPSMRR